MAEASLMTEVAAIDLRLIEATCFISLTAEETEARAIAAISAEAIAVRSASMPTVTWICPVLEALSAVGMSPICCLWKTRIRRVGVVR